MTRIILLIVCIAAMVVATLMLTAVPGATMTAQCGSTTGIADELAKRYGEHPVATGTYADGERMVLVANPETGTWSALIVKPGGVTCMVSAGNGFATVPPKPNL